MMDRSRLAMNATTDNTARIAPWLVARCCTCCVEAELAAVVVTAGSAIAWRSRSRAAHRCAGTGAEPVPSAAPLTASSPREEHFPDTIHLGGVSQGVLVLLER